jgi:hypothetical protein
MASSRLLAGALACLVMPACTVEIPGTPLGGGDDDEDSGGGSTGGGSDSVEGKLSSNGLVLDLEALTLFSPAPLGSWQSEGEAVADSGALDPLLAHPTGAAHIEYLATCALDEGTAITAGGVRYPGLLGLAPEWVGGECGPSCQRWISACVLAHANAFGVQVTMSLRGDHPGLQWSDADVAEFEVQEAAFYGNLFELEAGAFVGQPLYACSGRALVAFDEDPDDDETSHGYLLERICGVGQCGLEYTGPCVYPPVATASTCAVDGGWNGGYASCRGEELALQDPVYAEVITAYLVEE